MITNEKRPWRAFFYCKMVEKILNERFERAFWAGFFFMCLIFLEHEGRKKQDCSIE